MKYIKVSCLFVLIAIFISSCGEQTPPEKKAKYVFYFIGDGMGAAHLQMAEAYLQSKESDEIGFKRLALDTLPVHGLSTTHCNNRLTTGSASAGTALATGHKTNVGRISKSPDAKEDYQSIAYKLKDAGKRIGIITTVSIDHATPASFYANANYRKHYYHIGDQLRTSGFDYFAGGGFVDADSIPEKNLYNMTEEAGYVVYKDLFDLKDMPKDKKLFVVNPILGEEAEMPYAIDRKYDGGYSLADLVDAGINHLDNENGFFMMVEGGKIDWAAHENDAATIVKEVIDFDKAVQKALDFYTRHPDETLIVVTADHETGGLSLGTAIKGYGTDFKQLDNQEMSFYRAERMYHSGIITKRELSGIFGIEDPDDREKALINESKIPENNHNSYVDWGGYDPLVKTYNNLLNDRAGAGFTNWSHTAHPVPVYVIGCGQERFSGKYDNTDIPKRIMEATK